MINWQLPEDVSPKMDFLRELYNHALLMGALIYKAEKIFGFCEFAKPIIDQDEELAYLQFLATVEAVYKEENDRLQMHKLGEYMEEHCLGMLKQR